MTVRELALRMGSHEASEWRAWFGMAESPSPAAPPLVEDPLLEGDKLVAQLDATFGKGRGGQHG